MTFAQAKASGRPAISKVSGKTYIFRNSDNMLLTIAEYEGEWELEPEEVKVWTPKIGETSYAVCTGEGVGVYASKYDAYELDQAYKNNYALFSSYTEAYNVASFQRVQRKLLALAKVLNGEWKADWTNNNQNKYSIHYYCVANREFVIESWKNPNHFQIVFKSEQAAQKALSSLTEEEKQILIRGMQ